MPNNDFLAFATGVGANVQAQSLWATNPAAVVGFSDGIADPAQCNKAWRQPSVWANILGQFVNAAGLDANDDGNLAALLANFTAAIAAQFPQPTDRLGNLNYNASFAVAQRGTSITVNPGSPVYTLDGALVGCQGAAITVSQAGSIDQGPNSLQITGQAGVTDVFVIFPIESINSVSLAGSSAAFQAKIFNNTGISFTPTLSVRHPTTVDTNAGAWNASVTDINDLPLQACPNVQVTQVSNIFVANAGAANGMSVRLDFAGALNGAGKYIQIADVDTRPGSVLTPPGLLPYYLELLQCQRYLPSLSALGGISDTGSRFWLGAGGTYSDATHGGVSVSLKTSTRVPVGALVVNTLADFSVNYRGGWNTVTALSLNTATVDVISMDFTSNGAGGNANPGESTNLGAAVNGLIYFTGAELYGTQI